MSEEVSKEVWTVIIKDTKHPGFLAEYNVFATTAANAEMHGIRLATMNSPSDNGDDLYCISAQFRCRVF